MCIRDRAGSVFHRHFRRAGFLKRRKRLFVRNAGKAGAAESAGAGAGQCVRAEMCIRDRSEMMEKLYNNPVLRVLSKPVMDLDKITASASPSPNRWPRP